jgi:hypothetical protein
MSKKVVEHPRVVLGDVSSLLKDLEKHFNEIDEMNTIDSIEKEWLDEIRELQPQLEIITDNYGLVEGGRNDENSK